MLERVLFSKIETWGVLLILIIGIVGSLFFGWSVQYKAKGGERGGKVGDLLLSVAEIPEPAVKLLFSATDPIQPQRIAFADFSGLVRRDQDFADDGVLLVSSYSDEDGVSIVYLYDLLSGKILHKWVPPVEQIFEDTTYRTRKSLKENYRTQHPFLLENGDIIFTSGEGPLVRINACSDLVWIVDRHFHHSIERSQDGLFYVPHVFASAEDENSVTTDGHVVPIRDDGFAKISPGGEILQEWSVKGILERLGYQGLLYGVGSYELDRIHLNDVEPIAETDAYVRAGDLVLSIRQLSTVLLYRPATDEIIWLKTGPWLNQHDVDYQGDGVFTIFGNDMIRANPSTTGLPPQISLRGYSTIWKYDQKTDEVSKYLPMDSVDIYTSTQGLHRVLKNGDVFVEEQNKHLLHRVSDEGLRWSYANSIGENLIGAMHWSRYLTPEEATFPWLDGHNCDA